jgi:restriction system protein
MKKKTLLVRSPKALIKSGCVGYGFKAVNFSLFPDATALFDEFKTQGINPSRRRKAATRFFNITEGDRILVPLNRTIAIGYATGIKSFEASPVHQHTENRQAVSFLADASNVMFISRDVLSTKLQQRLKIRMANTDLSEFNNELDVLEERLSNEQSFCPSMIISEKTEDYINDFKQQLMNKLRKNKDIKLKAGGEGLERLVKELFECENYSGVTIPSKHEIKGKGDIDVKATKVDFTGVEQHVYCQVKHHDKFTGKKAVDQLIEARKLLHEPTISARYIVMTTAEISDEVKEYATANDIICMNGSQLTEWLYSNLDSLNDDTLAMLGIAHVPRFIE